MNIKNAFKLIIFNQNAEIIFFHTLFCLVQNRDLYLRQNSCDSQFIQNHAANTICEQNGIIYSGANKYLIHCRFFKFSHLQIMERSVIFIIGTEPKTETE